MQSYRFHLENLGTTKHLCKSKIFIHTITIYDVKYNCNHSAFDI